MRIAPWRVPQCRRFVLYLRMMSRCVSFALRFAVFAVAGSLLLLASGAMAQETPKRMEVVARAGPWPVISRVIGYRGRVWFANSVKGVNHNSADLWSLDPKTSEVRYERHLFSQDAGEPMVYKGLLYWPYEDTRSSLGWGGVDVTNGEDWRFLAIPGAQIFHTHALAEWQGDLLAVSSAWRMGLQRSGDGGLTWRPIYDHPTPTGRVSRMTSFVSVDGQGIGRLRESNYTRLIRWDGKDVHDVLDWGQGVHFHGLTAHGVAAYLIRTEKIGSTVWTVEGEVVRRFSPPKYGWNVQDMTSDGEKLWAVTRTKAGGELWSSKYGISWTMEATFEGGTPDNVAAADGAVYVGGTDKDGRGILWALMPDGPAGAFSGTPPDLPLQPSPGENGAELETLGRELDAALKVPENFRNHGRGVLRELVFKIAQAGPPAGFLAQRLDADMPDWQAPMLGGQFTVPAQDLGRWILLWGMGLSKNGPVPTDYLMRPWTVPAHGSEKYFDPLLMALWAVIQTGQNDDETVGTLIARLGNGQDPLWVTGEVVGTLSALTGQRFGYDKAAWRTWWSNR